MQLSCTIIIVINIEILRKYLRQWEDHPLMYLHGETAAGQGCRLGEICHPVHGTIRVVHVPRLYHHCHPSSKIKLISHMSARSTPFTYAFDSVAWHNMKLLLGAMKDWFGGWHSNNGHCHSLCKSMQYQICVQQESIFLFIYNELTDEENNKCVR